MERLSPHIRGAMGFGVGLDGPFEGAAVAAGHHDGFGALGPEHLAERDGRWGFACAPGIDVAHADHRAGGPVAGRLGHAPRRCPPIERRQGRQERAAEARFLKPKARGPHYGPA